MSERSERATSTLATALGGASFVLGISELVAPGKVGAALLGGPDKLVWTWVVANAPGGGSARWEAQITEDRAGERIAWQSVPGSAIENGGSVEFAPAAGGGDGTEVRVGMGRTRSRTTEPAHDRDGRTKAVRNP